jgi:predicted lipoprotein
MKEYLGIFILLSVLFAACSDDSDIDNEGGKEYDYTAILNDYVDNTVVATYAAMKDNSKLLLASTKKFVDSGSQTDLNQACADWKATRKPWESSEAFLFGPADYKDLDPQLDSWPLDQTQLDQVLAGKQELTAEFVRNGLGSGLRGFHTIEYLIFREGSPRNAAEVTVREKQYLAAVTEVLRDDCTTLWALWAGVTAGTEEAEILENIDVSVGTPYAKEFKNAGQAGSRYLSQTSAVEEIIQGMIDIAAEVGSQKIAGPVKSQNVLDVESWFSWNSLTDFTNNVRSVENSYINGYNGSTPGESLSAFVKNIDPTIDAEVKAKIAAAVTAINNIPAPFRNSLNNTEKTSAAIAAMSDLEDVLTKKVLPLVVD